MFRYLKERLVMGWFSAKCPVTPEEKSWLEERMNWLLAQYGVEHLWDVEIILPTKEYFPEYYDGSEDAARKLFKRVCKYMKVEDTPIELAFYDADKGLEIAPGICIRGSNTWAAGTYEADEIDKISIEREQLKDPYSLVGTMAHELGHLHLLGGKRLFGYEKDNEQLTDLVTVFLGLGIFTANSSIQEKNWKGAGTEGWSVAKQGYLSLEVYGYAFSLFAYGRKEENPSWSKYLRPDVKTSFKKGLKYLTKTGDTKFKAKNYIGKMKRD